jgi:transposase-like protein
MENDRSKEHILKARLARERATARKRGNKRVRFSLAARQEAVELAAVSGRSREQFALDLGISKTALQRWTSTRRSGAAFHHVKVETAATESVVVAIVFPSGAQLTGLSWEQVRQLLGVGT